MQEVGCHSIIANKTPSTIMSGWAATTIEPCRYFADKGGRVQFFAILCGRLLWMAPYADFHYDNFTYFINLYFRLKVCLY